MHRYLYLHLNMKEANRLLVAGILMLLVLGAQGQTKKVLLIGIDGCRPDALQAASTPNMDALIGNATYTYDALNEGITYSGPGWASLTTGVWPDKHGVTDNSFAGSDFAAYPHLFQRIEEFDPSLHTVSICQWHPVNNAIATGFADVTINVDDHTDYVESAAIEYLTNEDPDALFLHFDDVDHAGHSYGFSVDVPEYISSIETVDQGIGGVIAALNARPTFSEEEWVIIVSTDHGGIGYSHGGNTFDERNIFMIVSGDEVTNQNIHAESMDIAIPPIFNCLGDTAELFFDGSALAQSTSSQLFEFGAEQDFTIECRVRTDVSGDYAIMTDKDWDSGFNPGWVFSFNVNGGPWKVNVGDGNNRLDVEGNEISDGEWHMLSATFDRDGMLTIYEDGVMVNETSMAAIGDITSGNQIYFGADIDADYNFTGYIAEGRIFAELIPAAVISDWACDHLSAAHPQYNYLAAQWAMNDGVGTALSNDGANSLVTSLVEAEWQNATDTTYTTELDFSNTPRQVDFMVSALEHLCVPILEEWDLDGQALGTTCVTDPNGVYDDLLDQAISIFPMSGIGIVGIKTTEQGVFSLFDLNGKLIVQKNLLSGRTDLDLKGYSNKAFLYEIITETGQVKSGTLWMRAE